MMGVDDQQEILNDLLARWYHWALVWSPAIGYPKEIPTRRLHTISSQHEAENGCRDLDIEDRTMQGVDGCIEALIQPYKTAIQFNARNLYTGAAVWRSPRLPEDDMDRALLLQDARRMLLCNMQRCGVV